MPVWSKCPHVAECNLGQTHVPWPHCAIAHNWPWSQLVDLSEIQKFSENPSSVIFNIVILYTITPIKEAYAGQQGVAAC